MSKSILILTTEPLPLPGMAATGAGLRAWQLEKGLCEAGLDAAAAMPLPIARASLMTPECDTAGELPDNVQERCFRLDDISGFISERAPDAIVLQHWGLFDRLGETDCPLAIDLAGPHVLERHYWGSPHPVTDINKKITALRRADFLLCSGQYQKYYFLPFLVQSGWTGESLNLPVLPFAWPAALDSPDDPTERAHKFVYGGMLLPWQDPAGPLTWLLEVMDEVQAGELLFIGGVHPGGDVSQGGFEALMTRLESHERVRVIGRMAFDDFYAALRECGWAVDVMARNPERELAFATRSVVYLSAGLGLLHSDYTELAPLIKARNAGITFSPLDKETFKSEVRKLLRGEIDLAEKSEAARLLVNEDLATSRHIKPLVDFCKNPYRRKSEDEKAQLEIELDFPATVKMQRELDDIRAELATLRGKSWVKWGERLIELRPIWALIGFIVGVLAGPFLFLSFLLSRLNPRD